MDLDDFVMKIERFLCWVNSEGEKFDLLFCFVVSFTLFIYWMNWIRVAANQVNCPCCLQTQWRLECFLSGIRRREKYPEAYSFGNYQQILRLRLCTAKNEFRGFRMITRGLEEWMNNRCFKEVPFFPCWIVRGGTMH